MSDPLLSGRARFDLRANPEESLRSDMRHARQVEPSPDFSHRPITREPAQQTPAGGVRPELAEIMRRLEALNVGHQTLARRRDIIELYTKISADLEANGGPASAAPGSDRLVQEIKNLRDAVRSLEGQIHVALERSVDKAVAKSVGRATQNRRKPRPFQSALHIGLLGFLAVMVTACFALLILTR